MQRLSRGKPAVSLPLSWKKPPPKILSVLYYRMIPASYLVIDWVGEGL